MDETKAVPAPYGEPTTWEKFRGGFRQGLGASLAPTLGRIALAGCVVLLVVIGVIGVLSYVLG